MPKFFLSRHFLTTVTAVFAAGAALNMAHNGTFGASVKKAANYITEGFGAGPLN